MITEPEAMPDTAGADEIISKVEQVGVSYVRLAGCAVLNDGTWLQPAQWRVWVNHIVKKAESNVCD